ncbi:molybdopterin converting factor small subunit [Arcticibacter pallidicorallinus]|uniref:Molybdopterin converting factor small subunit n=1 Tax=Arcticibacter pallidicorallinus TaxID=1259464 RepID=A0A2T0U4G7_9SPHI|nr:MoaD/ThiS family protein [Arcticibacter pallidicorallinus]PRY52811.1 molybdopterin converting factor small subunit [Arcticibacter pallidicorallinus]
MKIEVFAALKNYFSKEFEITEQLETVADLRQHLKNINPSSSQLINMCRFVVQEDLVTDAHPLLSNDHVVVLPPSSGG